MCRSLACVLAAGCLVPPNPPLGREAKAPESPSADARWDVAIHRYAPRVKPGDQPVPVQKGEPFAEYIRSFHNRVHPAFEAVLSNLDARPARDPRNDPKLVVTLEMAIGGGDGRIVQMGVVRSSGEPSFDAGVLDAVAQAAPYPVPTPDVLSSDGNWYVHWRFHRDPVYGCTSLTARSFRLALAAAPR